MASGCLFGSVLPNTLRDYKCTIYTLREEKYHFRPGDGQALTEQKVKHQEDTWQWKMAQDSELGQKG